MKDGLNQIAGHCRVAADQHAGVTEQITGMSIEARPMLSLPPVDMALDLVSELAAAAARYGTATHSFALAHPSLPNYLAIAGGSMLFLAASWLWAPR